MPIKRMPLEEADAFGIPRETWVIEFGDARLRKSASPPLTETERECRYEWAYQAMCDYEDEAYYEDDDALSAYYRAEAKVWALMLCDLGLRFWRRDGSGFWRAMALRGVPAHKPAQSPPAWTPALHRTLQYVADGGLDGRQIIEILIAAGGGDPASEQLQALRHLGYIEEDAQPPKDRPHTARISATGKKALAQ